MAVVVAVWHWHRRVGQDDVIELLEKLDPLEAEDDAEDTNKPQSREKKTCGSVSVCVRQDLGGHDSLCGKTALHQVFTGNP